MFGGIVAIMYPSALFCAKSRSSGLNAWHESFSSTGVQAVSSWTSLNSIDQKLGIFTRHRTTKFMWIWIVDTPI